MSMKFPLMKSVRVSADFFGEYQSDEEGKHTCLALNDISHFRVFREDALIKLWITSQTWSATHASSRVFSAKAERKVEIEPTLEGERRCLQQKPSMVFISYVAD